MFRGFGVWVLGWGYGCSLFRAVWAAGACGVLRVGGIGV